MHSATLSHFLKLESLLDTAEKVFLHEALPVPRYREINELISKALQRVTTERLRLEVSSQ